LPAGASPSGGVVVAFVCGGTVIFISSHKLVAVTVDSCLVRPARYTCTAWGQIPDARSLPGLVGKLGNVLAAPLAAPQHVSCFWHPKPAFKVCGLGAGCLAVLIHGALAVLLRWGLLDVTCCLVILSQCGRKGGRSTPPYSPCLMRQQVAALTAPITWSCGLHCYVASKTAWC